MLPDSVMLASETNVTRYWPGASVRLFAAVEVMAPDGEFMALPVKLRAAPAAMVCRSSA